MIAIRKKQTSRDQDQRDAEADDLAGLVRTGLRVLAHSFWFCPRANEGEKDRFAAACGGFEVQRPTTAWPDAVPSGARVGRSQRIPRGFDRLELCEVESRGVE